MCCDQALCQNTQYFGPGTRLSVLGERGPGEAGTDAGFCARLGGRGPGPVRASWCSVSGRGGCRRGAPWPSLTAAALTSGPGSRLAVVRKGSGWAQCHAGPGPAPGRWSPAGTQGGGSWGAGGLGAGLGRRAPMSSISAPAPGSRSQVRSARLSPGPALGPRRCVAAAGARGAFSVSGGSSASEARDGRSLLWSRAEGEAAPGLPHCFIFPEVLGTK